MRRRIFSHGAAGPLICILVGLAPVALMYVGAHVLFAWIGRVAPELSRLWSAG